MLPTEIMAAIAVTLPDRDRLSFSSTCHAARGGVLCIVERPTADNYMELSRRGRFLSFLWNSAPLPNYAAAFKVAKDFNTLRAIAACAQAEGMPVDLDEAMAHLFQRNPWLPARAVLSCCGELDEFTPTRNILRTAAAFGRMDILTPLLEGENRAKVLANPEGYPEIACVSRWFPEWRPSGFQQFVCYASPFFENVDPRWRPDCSRPTMLDFRWAAMRGDLAWIDYLCGKHPCALRSLVNEMMPFPEVAMHVVKTRNCAKLVAARFLWLLSKQEHALDAFRNREIYEVLRVQAHTAWDSMSTRERFAFALLGIFNGDDTREIVKSLKCEDCGGGFVPTRRAKCECGSTSGDYASLYAIVCALVGMWEEYTPRVLSHWHWFSGVLMHLCTEEVLPRLMDALEWCYKGAFSVPADLQKFAAILERADRIEDVFWINDAVTGLTTCAPAQCQVLMATVGARRYGVEVAREQLENVTAGGFRSHEAFARLAKK